MALITPRKEEDARIYTGPDGIQLPSVTTVLKLFENDSVWMNKVIASKGRKQLSRLRTEGAALGTKVHGLAHRIAHDRDYESDDEEMAPFAQAIKELYAEHIAEVIQTEFSLVSAKERVGGTLDKYVILKTGEYAVIDMKAKKTQGITEKDRVQTALYALLLTDNGFPVQKRMVVRFHTKEGWRGRWYAKFANDHIRDVRMGRACVELWHSRYGHTLGA